RRTGEPEHGNRVGGRWSRARSHLPAGPPPAGRGAPASTWHPPRSGPPRPARPGWLRPRPGAPPRWRRGRRLRSGRPAWLAWGHAAPSSRREDGEGETGGAVPCEPETLRPGGLHRHSLGREGEDTRQVVPDLVAAPRDRRAFRQHGAIARVGLEPSVPNERHGALQEDEALHPRVLGVGVREVLPEVAE